MSLLCLDPLLYQLLDRDAPVAAFESQQLDFVSGFAQSLALEVDASFNSAFNVKKLLFKLLIILELLQNLKVPIVEK